MARTIAAIKAEIAETFIAQEQIRTIYQLDPNKTFDKQFSPASLESVILYVVASCIWVLEKLFDKHREEVDAKIETLRPHTLRWYVSKTLEYMKGKDLIMEDGVVIADHYDLTGMSESDIEKKRIVKYAVATEDESAVYIKVAKKGDYGLPTPLSTEAGNDELAGLRGYLQQIKDAGVTIKLLNDPADNMRVELVVLYDPYVITATPEAGAKADRDGYTASRLLKEGKEVVKEAVTDVITKLPFNGEYRNSDLLAAVQRIEGVKVADIVSVEAAPGGSTAYTKVVGYRRPYSGYYALQKLTIKARPYEVAENS